MEKKLLTGNEAIARGAYEAGVKFASAYPGTPSTEILENITSYSEIYSEWAPNEKVALEAAIGASFAGVRSMASMKHVGVNVAADPLFTCAYTGVNAGMVLISADEPGMHSSQNEQDNRNYAVAAKVPMLEPSTSHEAKDMLKEAFEISERFDTPVLFRVTTRLCHSKGIVECVGRNEVETKEYVKNAQKYVTVPAFARTMRVKVEQRMKNLIEFSESTPMNFTEDNGSKTGVICSGVCYSYAREVWGSDASYLKLGFTNPLPKKMIAEFCKDKETVYIIEENDPYIENTVKALGIDCKGNDLFPPYGEMTPDVLRAALGERMMPGIEYDTSKVVNRPPTLCAGCPHRGLFYELGRRKNTVIAGDIGCYSLAFAPPYNALDFIVCMGASFSSGHGLQKALDFTPGNEKRVASVMGDSTFFHTGINSLIEVLYNNSRTVNIILDNRITGMTGHQENPGTGYTAGGDSAYAMDIETVVKALGAKNVRTINPNDLAQVKETLDWAFSLNEPSVIITRWPCVLKRFSAEDKEEFNTAFKEKCSVDHEKCVGCGLCLRCGCPAVSLDKSIKKSSIDPNMCVGCGVCAQICPKSAISEVK